MKHMPFVFIDIETTGASPRGARVMEIGALRVENNQVVKTFTQLLNPGGAVPPFITKLTGIKTQDVWDKPSFRDIAAELEELLYGAVFVAHNVNFDYSFIKNEYSQLNVAFNKDRLCTVRLSRALYPNERSHRLDAVIARHGYTVSNRHRAFDDAEVLYKFYTDQLNIYGMDLYKTMHKLTTYARQPF